MRKFITTWRLRVATITFLGSATGTLVGKPLALAVAKFLWGGVS